MAGPTPAGTPEILGTVLPGYQVTVTTGVWLGATSFSYVWQTSTDGISFSNTSVATSYYNVTRADLGKYLRVVVTATGPGGSTNANSDTVGPIYELGFVCQLETTPLAHFSVRGSHDTGGASTPGPFSGSWVDISKYLMGWSLRRGKQRTLARFEAGTLSATLRNDDQRFDPNNTQGPYAATLVPYRAIRLGIVVNSVTYWFYWGFVERWPQAYKGPTWSQVDITAVDALAALQQNGISSAYAQYAPTGLIIAPTITSVAPGAGGNSISVVTIQSGTNTALSVSTSSLTISVHLATNGSGNVTSTWNDVAQAIAQDTTASALVTVDVTSISGQTASARTMQLSGGTFTNALSGTRFTEVLDQIRWWTDMRNIDTGHISIQAQSDIPQDRSTTAQDHLAAVADSEQGFFFADTLGRVTLLSYQTLNSVAFQTAQATFVDAKPQAGNIPYMDVQVHDDLDLVYNDVRVTRLNGTLQQATNSTSTQYYFDRPLSAQPLMDSDVTALGYAQHVVTKYGNPTPYFTGLKVKPGENTSYWTTLLGLELGDPVRIVRDPPGSGDRIDKTQNIIGITMECPAPASLKNVTFTYEVDITDPYRYLIFDSGSQGNFDQGYAYAY